MKAGKDTNPGSAAAPFQHVQKAALLAEPGDTVYVRGGTYAETVTPARSGLPGKPITFRPYKNEVVAFRGTGTVAPTEWRDEGNGLWSAPWGEAYVSDNNQSDQVFVDERMAQLARWPAERNNDVSRPFRATINSVQSTEKTDKRAPGPQYEIWRTTFTSDEFSEPEGVWPGAEVWLNNGQATDTQDGNGLTGTVIATDAAKHQITIEIAAKATVGTGEPPNFSFGRNSRFYLFNPKTVSGLRNTGEWWHDAGVKRIFLRLAPGDSPAKHRVEIKRRDWAFQLDSRSYVTVQGFKLFGCSITTDKLAGNGRENGGDRKNSVAPAHHIVLDRLDCRYVTHFTDQSGDYQTQWNQSSGIILSGSDCVLRNSDIAYSAGCGIVCIGERNKVLNNIVHDLGYNATDGGGIGLGVRPYTVSRDIEVGYNTVYNVGIDGIEFGALKGSDPNRPGTARIHHNIVHDTVLQSADSGALHTFDSNGMGTRIDHNIVYNTGGPSNEGYLYFGIYLDYAPNDGKSPGNYIVDHNVVYNTPSPLNLNHANADLITNNTIISATIVARSSISSNGGTYEGVILQNNLGNTVYRGDLDEASIKAGKNKAVYRNNVVDAKSDIFVDATNPDMAKRNYRLKAANPNLVNKGADAKPWNDAIPPDIGAYEFGGPDWTAGAKRPLVNK
jgi:hypothetical protein